MASKKELKALITLAGKIDPSLQSAMLKASNLSMKAAQNAQKSGNALSKVSTIAKGVFLGNLATKVVSGIGEGLRTAGMEGLNFASDMTEVQNVVDTTFGTGVNQINNWSKKALEAFGLSELQAKKFTGTLGAMMKSSGISQKYLIGMSQNLSGLAGDFSSFYNLSQEDAFDKIRAGISGETEPLKQLGINMSVANLQAYALSQGIKTSYEKMDQASQTMLRYSYLMKVSKDAQGDFAKTLDTSYANQKRLFSTNWNQLAAQIASAALPAATNLTKLGNSLLTSINPEKLMTVVGRITNGVMGKVQQFAPQIINLVGQIGPTVLDAFNVITESGVMPMVLSTVKELVPVVLPIVRQVLPLISSTLGQIMPLVLTIVKSVLPLLPPVLQILMAVIKPLLPVIVEIVGQLTPIITQVAGALLPLLQALIPVISFLAKIIGFSLSNNIKVAVSWIKFIATNITNLAGILTSVVNFITNVFTGNWSAAWQNLGQIATGIFKYIGDGFKGFMNGIIGNINGAINSVNYVGGIIGKAVGINISIPNIPTFARGGFASRSSIFGEAGLEAAIPIKRGNPRSLSLLKQTANMLGVGGGGLVIHVDAPISISGVGNAKEILEALESAGDIITDKVYEAIEKYFLNNRRHSYGAV